MPSKQYFDVLVIGAGAAGMMCAARLGQAGLRVALFDHATKIGEKIRISGGGRCNFTNLNLNGHDGSAYFVSEQPRFVRPALARFHSGHFLALVERYGIQWHEKHKGQLFCSHRSTDIINMLQSECQRGNVVWHTGQTVQLPFYSDGLYSLKYPHAIFSAPYLVVATGGLAAPAVGATPFGYEIAKHFGHRIVSPRAALVPLRFEDWEKRGFHHLAGISLPVGISTLDNRRHIEFSEDLLFRHKGLSGPAILQISSYWQPGQTICIDLCSGIDIAAELKSKQQGQKIYLHTALKQLCPHLPDRLIEHWFTLPEYAALAHVKWADCRHSDLDRLGNGINSWTLIPSGSDGHKKAEATRGGIAVQDIDPQTMQSRLQSGLYFVGEVMDITGWLGGYNFQWAWSSAVCAAVAITASKMPTGS